MTNEFKVTPEMFDNQTESDGYTLAWNIDEDDDGKAYMDMYVFEDGENVTYEISKHTYDRLYDKLWGDLADDAEQDRLSTLYGI
jgi:hypothetical protein